jgi:hypothetical protein
MQDPCLIEAARERRTKWRALYNLTMISARASGEVQQFELANLLRHPDQGVLEPRHHV